MPDLHSLPANSRPNVSVTRNNGSDALALERYKLRELAEGWPCYRDACEWSNFRTLFHHSAHVYTTWTGRIPVEDFIKLSQDGMDRGAFIMHRVHGTTTDISENATRAVTKMKAAITQRFVLPCSVDGKKDCEVDVDADCRFCFFWVKEEGRWQAKLVRHWYEKDKLVPVDPRQVPELDDEKLGEMPRGYRFLAYCQESAGMKVDKGLPGHRREGEGSVNGRAHNELYWLCKRWVEGEDVEL